MFVVGLLTVAMARTTDPATDPRWLVDRWTIADGLPIDHIADLARTPDGFLWIGTFDGLVRFDGAQFVTYRRGELGLPASRVLSVRADPDGALWVLFEPGDVARIDERGTRVWLGRADLPAGAAALYVVPAGVFVLSRGLLHHLRGEEFVRWRADLAPLQATRAADGGLWVSTDDTVHHLGADGAERQWTLPGIVPQLGLAVQVVLSEHGALAVADGIWELRGDGVATPIARLPEGVRPRTASTSQPDGSLIIHGHHDMWSWKDGVIMPLELPPFESWMTWRDPEPTPGWAHLPQQILRDGRPVLTLQTAVRARIGDGDDGVWVGTNGEGLLHLRRSLVETLRPEASTSAVLQTPDGAVWIGTDSGLHVARAGAVHDVPTRRADGSRPRFVGVTWLAPGLDGAVWTDSAGGCLVRSEVCEVAAFVPPLQSNWTRPLAVGPAGTLWVDSAAGGVERWPVDSPLPDGRPSRADVDPVHALLRQPGGIWLGYRTTGLGFIGPDLTPKRVVVPGLRSERIRSLSADGEFVWLGTADGGLCRLVAGPTPSAACLGVADGLPTATIHAVVRDRHDQLWMSTNQGLLVVERDAVLSRLDGGAAPIQPLQLDERDGMISREANAMGQPAVILAQDGAVLATTQRGVARVEPDRLVFPTPPRAWISTVVAGDTELPRGADGVSVPAGTAATVSWAAPELRWPDQVRFRYRLDDATWTEAGMVRRATLAWLPPGAHRFQVAACLAGRCGEPTSLILKRPRTLAETRWVPAAAAAVAALLALAGALWRDRRRRRDDEVLEAQVARRTEEIRSRNVEITAQADRIAAQARQLRDANELTTRFVANLSHEVRTPLTLLTARLRDLDELRRGDNDVTAALRHADRLTHLVEQMFDLTRLQSGTLPLRARNLDLCAFTRRFVERVAPEAARRGLALTCAAQGQVALFFDPDLIESVLGNLVDNALKFTPPGGRVRVVVEPPTPLSLLPCATVRVIDTGPGLAPDEQERVFNRFYQVDRGDNRRHEGAGIGLAFAHDLVALHGGAIGVASVVGEGANFWFTLPAGAAHLAPGEVDLTPRPVDLPLEPVPVDSADDARPVVLVVEDHPDMRDYLRAQLQDGWEVRTAGDGRAALEVLGRRRVDVVVADVRMPRLDGLALATAMRADVALAHVPVLLMSARASEEDRVAGMRVADDYLTKPFSMAELRLRVAALLRRAAHAVPGANSLDDVDQRFLVQLRAAVLACVGDPRLDVDVLSEGMGVPRRELQREVARLCGQLPDAYVLRVRMEHARSLLEGGQHTTVAGVATAVGMNAGWFIRLYSNWHGHPPSEHLSRPPNKG